MGKIYMIMGKSASGKDHIYRSLAEDPELGLQPLVLYTTRPQRAGETDGKEYYFTTVEHLQELRRAGRIIEERVYATVFGDWYYFTADEGQIDPAGGDYITIGTLQSFVKMKNYFGEETVCPVYIETNDEIRLLRAIKREKKQEHPAYREVCRRFLADEEDFSEKKLTEAGVRRRFVNDTALQDCIDEIRQLIIEGKTK